MSWYGQQDYAARLTAEEAAALVILSEAKWDAKHSFGRGDERGVEFNGTYDTVLESDAVCVGAALIDQSDLRGIVFPWCYCSEFGYCPASFVFKCSDALSDDGQVLWDLVTPRPLILKTATLERLSEPYDCYWASHEPGVLPDVWPWSEHWPDERNVSVQYPVVFRLGGRVVLRKDCPGELTLFLAVARSLLKINLMASPNPRAEVESWSNGQRRFEEALARARRASEERVAHWRLVFGLTAAP